MSFYNINHIFFLFLYFSFCEREKREIYAESTTSPAKCSFSFARIFGPREYANSCFITASKYIMCKKVVSVRFFFLLFWPCLCILVGRTIFSLATLHTRMNFSICIYFIYIYLYIYMYTKKKIRIYAFRLCLRILGTSARLP